MAQMTQITPFLHCTDLDAEIAFFRDVLGFEVTHQSTDPDYAFMRRDQVALRLINAGADVAMVNGDAPHMVYIDVEDIDALYAELKPALDRLPEGRVWPLQDRVYGQREFHVRDEGPYLIMFGQGIG
jgi:catechol 2,3-dioxygenase-like lactoylglutathione lyase family enzyme